MDAVRKEFGTDMAIINAGNIRGFFEQGPLDSHQVFEVVPLKNNMVKLKLTEKEIVDALKKGAKSFNDPGHKPGIIMPVSYTHLSVLMDKLAESMKTNQPFRIDFDKDVSVIIKVNKDGSLAANFIPGDKAVEQYLRNNIASLRQRFDEQDLSYTQLSYSNSRQQQQQKRQNKEKQ